NVGWDLGHRPSCSKAGSQGESGGKATEPVAAGLFPGSTVQIHSARRPVESISLVPLHRGVETMFLQLMDVVFRLLKALTGQDALALLMDLEHVKLGLLFGPPKDFLEYVCYVLHIINRIIPANNQVARLQFGF